MIGAGLMHKLMGGGESPGRRMRGIGWDLHVHRSASNIVVPY